MTEPSPAPRPPGPEQAGLWAVAPAVDASVERDALEEAGASDERRWRAQTVVAPIEQLARSLAHAQIDEDQYDVRRLAHRAIDLAVRSMGFAQETTDDEVIEDLAAMARAMQPEAGSDAWRDVAARIFRGLLNEQHEYEKFQFTAIPADGIRRPFSFRLLELREHGEGYIVEASDEAINVFLSALNAVEPSDAEYAFQTLLARQLEDGRLEHAANTAAIADAIESARRDVDSERWAGEVEPILRDTADRVRGRIEADDRLLEKVHDLTESEDADTRRLSGQVGETVRGARQVHLALERRLVTARPAFLEAQRLQRLAPRRRLRVESIDRDLFRPTLGLPRAASIGVTDRFAEEALGVVVPRLLRLDTMVDLLLRPPLEREPRPSDVEVLDEDDDWTDPQLFSEEVLAAARAILGVARTTPRRLSELLAAARASGDDDVVIVVRLSALFAYAPERSDDPDEEDSRPNDIVEDLAALDDGARLDDPEYAGADLLVGATAAIAAIAAPPPAEPAPPAPIPIERARSRR
jgi:hypothetical protein